MENKKIKSSSISKEAIILAALCLGCCVSVFLFGNFSDLYLGDETFHFRLADYVFKADFKRPLFDPLALTNPIGKSFYVDPMGWHYLLAFFWKFTLPASKIFAQLYQVIWYLALIIFAYLLGKELRDKKTGLFAALLAATAPFAVALSILLHTDIPVAAAAAATVYLLVRKKIFFAAITCAGMTYIKRNSYMLLPAIIIISLYFVLSNRRGFKGFIKGFLKWLLIFILPILILITPEIIYRYMTFGIHSFWSGNIIRPNEDFRLINFNISNPENKLTIKLNKVNIPLTQKIRNREVNIIATQPKLTTQISLRPSESLKTPEILDNIRTAKPAIPPSQAKQNDNAKIIVTKPENYNRNTSITTLTATKPLLITPKSVSEENSKTVAPEINNSTADDSNRNNVSFSYSEEKKVSFFDESNFLADPAVLAKYFGVFLILGLLLYFILLAGKKRDLLLWLLVLTYLPIYFYVFKLGLNMRYLSPILAFLTVISAIGLAKIKFPWIRKVLFTACLMQFLAVGIYTYNMRIIPAGLKQAYIYIRDNSDESSRVMCSKNALSLYGNRYSIWLGVPSLHELNYLFWQADEFDMLRIFKKYDINYILAEKDKIYDDTSVRHTGGYPKSFINKIYSGKIFTLIQENNDAILWKIKRE